MKKISMVTVDDHQLIREMWNQLFSTEPEIEIVGQCGGMEEGVEMIKKLRPDIVLLDINLSGGSGLEAVPLIRKFAPGTRIIAVSMHKQPAYAKKMMQMGAKGYVTKNSSHKEILEAVKTVMNGQTYICIEIKNIISEKALNDNNKEPDIKELSLREIELIKLLKEGFSSKEIAQQMNISTRTAEVHRHNILKKLGLKNTASLINFINTTDLSL